MLKNTKYILSVILMAGVALAGCWNTEKSVRYEDLYGRAVLVSVGGEELIKAKLERDVALRVALEAERNKKLTVAKADKLKKALYGSAIENFIQKTTYRSIAKELGVFAGVEELARVRAQFLKRYSRGRVSDWEKFASRFDKSLLSGLEQDLAFEALKAKVDDALVKRYTTVPSEAELKEIQRKQKAYNERAAKENAAIYQNASNLWRRIVADRSTNAFEKAVAEYATGHEHMTTDGAWGAFTLQAFTGDEQLFRLVPTLKVGDVTPPVEGDNGLVILKLVSAEPRVTEPPRKDMYYTFSKIFFELPEFFEELDLKTLGGEIAKSRAVDAAKAAVADRKQKLKIRYPSGKVVF